MVTEVVSEKKYGVLPDGSLVKKSEYYWLSTDEKPIDGVDNADVGYEMDTKKVFIFDEEHKVWIEQ